MKFRFLMDENLDPLYKTQLLAKKPDIVVCKVGDPGCPPRGTFDPEILLWCEKSGYVLVTDNRHSMPPHLRAHLAEECHIPGLITLNENMTIGDTIEELILIAEEGIPSRYQDCITYLPVT